MMEGSHEAREMIRILDLSMSLLRCGETDAEIFGVDADGVPGEVVLIMVRGEDYHHLRSVIDRLYPGNKDAFEEHGTATPEMN